MVRKVNKGKRKLSSGRAGSGRAEPVAHAVFGEDVFGLVGDLFKLVSPAADVALEIGDLVGVLAAPHAGQQGFVGHDPAGIAHEVVEQAVFGPGKRDGLAAHPCVGPERVEFVLPGCAVYAAIRQVWQVPSLTVADRGLREGMLIRMMRADAAAMARHAGRGSLVRDVRTQTHPPRPPVPSRLDP